MNEYVTRHEHDAKLNAFEERINSKFVAIMSTIDKINTRIDSIDQRLSDYRDDARYSKWALWTIAGAAVFTAFTLLIAFILK